MSPSPSKVAARYVEALRQGRFFLFTPFPLEKMERRYGMELKWGDPSSEVIPVANSERYRSFLKQLDVYSFATHQYNYIYEIKHPLRLFDGSERDCYRLAKAGLIDNKALAKYYGVGGLNKFDDTQLDPFQGPVEVAKFLSSKLKSNRNVFSDVLLNVVIAPSDFRRLYDGISQSSEGNDNYVFRDIALQHANLIDGTVMRMKMEEKPEGTEYPDWVMKELIRYTDAAGKKLNPAVSEWLLANSPKPYTTKRIYRGFGTQLDDWGDLSKLTIAEVNKRLFSRLGLRDIGKLRVGMPLKIKRGKESSWSVSAMAAANFSAGLASKSLNFLVKSEIPSNRVVIDFTELPTPLRSTFKFHGQGEVIVSAGPIAGVLDTLSLDPKFVVWLESQGYTFIPQKGVFPKAVQSPQELVTAGSAHPASSSD